MDDDLIEEIEITPQTHNRWAVIVPALDCIANIAGDVERMFKAYAIFGAQHGMQRQYDRRFKEVVDGNPGLRSGSVLPED